MSGCVGITCLPAVSRCTMGGPRAIALRVWRDFGPKRQNVLFFGVSTFTTNEESSLGSVD